MLACTLAIAVAAPNPASPQQAENRADRRRGSESDFAAIADKARAIRGAGQPKKEGSVDGEERRGLGKAAPA
jgi:hypothetical protein